MTKYKYKMKKRGNIFIPIGLLVLIVTISAVALVYCQINIIIENVRKDLFYASNSAILLFNLQDLSYKQYTIEESKVKDIIEDILNKNYIRNDGSITKIQVSDLQIFNDQEKVIIKTRVNITFNSVINIAGRREHSFNMDEEIRISLLNYQ